MRQHNFGLNSKSYFTWRNNCETNESNHAMKFWTKKNLGSQMFIIFKNFLQDFFFLEKNVFRNSEFQTSRTLEELQTTNQLMYQNRILNLYFRTLRTSSKKTGHLILNLIYSMKCKFNQFITVTTTGRLLVKYLLGQSKHQTG